MPNSLDQIYDEIILDHCKNPRNNRTIQNPQVICKSINPFCGDEVNIEIRLSTKNIVLLTGLKSIGCAINQASSSMLSEIIYGKSVQEILTLSNYFKSIMSEKTIPEKELNELGYLNSFKIIKQHPIRIKCCLLSWTAIIDGLTKISIVENKNF